MSKRALRSQTRTVYLKVFVVFTDQLNGKTSEWMFNDFAIGKERRVLFNDALNTFYLRLYGVGHMVKGHSDSESGNPPRHGLLFPIAARDILYAPGYRQYSAYHDHC